MLWTAALVILFAALTATLARAFHAPRPAPHAGRPAPFREALHRLATLPRPVLASPVLHRVGGLCAICGSLVPARQESCVVCAVDRALDHLTAGGPVPEPPIPAAVRQAGWLVAQGR